MNITTILFDLDGTLLPMDQEAFTTGYFKFLAKKLAPYGYEPKSLVDAIWAGTAAMVKNDGSCTNEQAFWKKFAAIYGEEKCQSDQGLFEDFYANEFNAARDICGFNPASVETVHKLKECGYRVALATNPIFPHMATENRIRWAGLVPEDFEIYTTYEASTFCKPNPAYYLEVARTPRRQAGGVPDGRQRRDRGHGCTRGRDGCLSFDRLSHQREKPRPERLSPRRFCRAERLH